LVELTQRALRLAEIASADEALAGEVHALLAAAEDSHRCSMPARRP
jgi:hypothetical protein